MVNNTTGRVTIVPAVNDGKASSPVHAVVNLNTGRVSLVPAQEHQNGNASCFAMTQVAVKYRTSRLRVGRHYHTAMLYLVPNIDRGLVQFRVVWWNHRLGDLWLPSAQVVGNVAAVHSACLFRTVAFVHVLLLCGLAFPSHLFLSNAFCDAHKVQCNNRVIGGAVLCLLVWFSVAYFLISLWSAQAKMVSNADVPSVCPTTSTEENHHPNNSNNEDQTTTTINSMTMEGEDLKADDHDEEAIC
jgi:hypothetical protein